MENKEGKCMCGGMCGCHHHHGRGHLVRTILKLVIVIIIFWAGFKLGQIEGSIRASEYGRSMMMRGGSYGLMMPATGNYTMPNTTPAVPATPAQ